MMRSLFGIKITKVSRKIKLQLFLTDLKNLNPDIKLSYNFNKEHISFLDLILSFCDGKLATDLHVKPTDRHQYLH